MAQFDFVIDASMVGQTIGPVDGFITDLAMTASPSSYENPAFLNGRWTNAYFTLKDESWRPHLFSFSPQSCSPFQSRPGGAGLDMLINASWPYTGALQVVSVPVGATFAISISDVPVRRSAA